jgi:hypothetical protein
MWTLAQIVRHVVPWAVLFAVVCGLVALIAVVISDRLRK